MELLFWCVVSPRLIHYSSKITYGEKILAPKFLHGLIAAGTDIWVLELSRKTLGERYPPATVSKPCLPLVIFSVQRSTVLSFLDIIFSRPILISLHV